MKGKSFDEEMRKKMQQHRKKMDDTKKIDIESELKQIRKGTGAEASSSDEDRKSSDEDDSESDPDYDEERYMTEEQKMELRKSREEYDKLKKEVLQFKKVKIGSMFEDPNNEPVNRIMTPLEMQRYRFLKNKKMTKNRENETLAKLNNFKGLIRTSQASEDDNNWMKGKLKFHIDSARAYNINKAMEYGKKNAGVASEDNDDNENKFEKKLERKEAQPDDSDSMQNIVGIDELVKMTSKGGNTQS